jgi:hypothetical protein
MEYTTISVTGPDGGGLYEYVGCYPDLVIADATETAYIKAMAGCLGISASDITVFDAIPSETDQNWGWQNPYRWVVFNKDESDSNDFNAMCGFLDAEYEKMDEYWETNGWGKWARAHPEEASVTTETRYTKAKLSYTNGNNTFIMTPMVAEDGTREFDSLAALHAAALVELPSHAMTSNR